MSMHYCENHMQRLSRARQRSSSNSKQNYTSTHTHTEEGKTIEFLMRESSMRSHSRKTQRNRRKKQPTKEKQNENKLRMTPTSQKDTGRTTYNQQNTKRHTRSKKQARQLNETSQIDPNEKNNRLNDCAMQCNATCEITAWRAAVSKRQQRQNTECTQ